MDGEQFTQGKYQMGYILKERSDLEMKEPWLICVFSAFAAPNSSVKHPYNFTQVLRNIPCHRLYLQDSLGELGSYYLCAGMDFAVSDTVLEIIETTREKLGVSKDHVITLGSSKGGTAALYFGLRGGYGHILSMGPQTQIAQYLLKYNGQQTLDFMAGDCNRGQAYEMLDNVIFQRLALREEHTVLHLLSSEQDNQYKDHVLPLLARLDLDSERNDIVIDNSITSHSDLGRVNPDFVQSRLISIITGFAIRWTDNGASFTGTPNADMNFLEAWFQEAPSCRAFFRANTLLRPFASGAYSLRVRINMNISASGGGGNGYLYKFPQHFYNKSKILPEHGKQFSAVLHVPPEVSSKALSLRKGIDVCKREASPLDGIVEWVNLTVLENRIAISLHGDFDETLTFAFELHREGRLELLKNRLYQAVPHYVFENLDPGRYAVKYYVRKGETRSAYYIRNIDVF